MSVEINFHLIRPHRGSRDGGFEELCAQIARLDDKSKGLALIRTGQGADAGVECYVTRSDGKQTGWQAKYLFVWDNSLEAQLDKSIAAALKRRPDLDEYIVCLPFDLPDAIKDGQTSARKKWEAWRAHWISAAGRPFTIELWGASELTTKLTATGAAHAGRLAYFFDTRVMDLAALKQRFADVRKALGSRYTPETHVELPIRKTFAALTRASATEDEIRAHVRAIAGTADKATQLTDPSVATEMAAMRTAIDALSVAVIEHAFDAGGTLPLTQWRTLTGRAIMAARDLLVVTVQAKGGALRDLGAATNSALGRLYDFDSALDDDAWNAWNAQSLFLVGDAGVGKSHLLADVVAGELDANMPGVLALGANFIDDEPWSQLLKQLGFPATYSVDEFLAALDAAAEANGRRALICIDALNERDGLRVWPHRLAAFLSVTSPYAYVCVAVSCRSIFERQLKDAIDNSDALLEVTHAGFGNTGGRAARDYLEKRGIRIELGPVAFPEFDNPLFLKTLCDLMDKRGQQTLTKGEGGFSAVFESYIEALCDNITKNLQLSPAKRIPERAIGALVDAMIKADTNYLDYDDAAAVVEGVHPSNNSIEQDLLQALASEGALDIEPDYDVDGPPRSSVRFTFERFGDHRIARRQLEVAGKAGMVASFATGGSLFTYAHDWRHDGVVAAMAAQLPEDYGLELPDLVGPDAAEDVKQAFFNSASARASHAFTAHTLKLCETLLDRTERMRVRVAIATDPGNPFNARTLFEELAVMPMPERDQVWSTALVEIGFENEVAELIDWVFVHGGEPMEEERAELAGIALTLMLSTSHRGVRDRATMALSVLLTSRLVLARRLLKRFASFDDLYVRERLFTAVYGAVMQGAEGQPLAELAGEIYADIFAGCRPPANVLLRDAAAGIIEYVAWRGVLPEAIDVCTVRPPFETDWKPDLIIEAEMEPYQQVYSDTYTGPDSIVHSIKEGDFGRYVADQVIDSWSISPLGSEPLRMIELYERWEAAFEGEAAERQRDAFSSLLIAAANAKGSAHHEQTPEQAALKAARQAFRAALGEVGYERYRQEAQNFVEHWLFSDRAGFNPIRETDRLWAYRWLIRRAHELGWSAARFGAFDRHLPGGGSRHEHRVERIGKKYQWLALYELAAHLGDTRVFLRDRFGDQPLRLFRGADQLGVRNIDPSLHVRATHYDGWRQWPSTWWTPVAPKLRHRSVVERLVWRDSDEDILDGPELIEVTDPHSGEVYFCLHGFAHWRQQSVRDRELDHETWYRVYCLLTRQENTNALIGSLKDTRLTASEHASTFDMGSCYVGENPWFAPIADGDYWLEPSEYGKFGAPVLAPVNEYLREKNGYDNSIDEAIGVLLPSPMLMQGLKLHLTSGAKLSYENEAGQRIFFDPSVETAGPQAALVHKKSFLEFLEREGLSAVWVVAGEKGVFGGGSSDIGFGGRALHSTIYWREGGQFARHSWRGAETPTASQLKRYLASGELPAGVDVEAIVARYAKPD